MSEPRGKPPKRDDEEDTLTFEVQPSESVLLSVRLAWLEQVRGPGAPRKIVLSDQETIVGRSDEATVVIGSKLISRTHMVLRKKGPVVRCEDLDSANGIFLNGVKAHAADLHEGDKLQIGDVVFVFHEGR